MAGEELRVYDWQAERDFTAASEIVDAAQAQGVELLQFAGASVANEATAAKAEPDPETDVLDELTPEQQARAADAVEALGDKYNRDYRDFSVVKLAYKKGEDVFAVVLTATKGIDLGNPKLRHDPKRGWDKLVAEADDSRFIVVVGGEKFDTRSPINGKLLKAVAKANPKIEEWAWCAGERHRANRLFAPITRMSSGLVGQSTNGGPATFGGWCVRGADGRYIRFRPAVVI
jgi:hypothetical protein